MWIPLLNYDDFGQKCDHDLFVCKKYLIENCEKLICIQLWKLINNSVFGGDFLTWFKASRLAQIEHNRGCFWKLKILRSWFWTWVVLRTDAAFTFSVHNFDIKIFFNLDLCLKNASLKILQQSLYEWKNFTRNILKVKIESSACKERLSYPCKTFVNKADIQFPSSLLSLLEQFFVQPFLG